MTKGLMRTGMHFVAALCAAGAAAAHAGACTLQSPPHRVTVLELFTSEGCSSCPPADRWLSSLPRLGIGPDNAILLAFHVDYWNRLGWPDRFSQARFSERQQAIAARNRSRLVYTPQLVLDGRPLRAGSLPEDVAEKLGAINQHPAGATIQASIVRQANAVRVAVDAQVLAPSAHPGADVWLAAFENGLSTEVARGENAGALLHHDFVVRDLVGPFSVGSDGYGHVEHEITAAPQWDEGHTGLAIFVQDRTSGEILQAAAMLPVCHP
jgi:hypothetical protein